MNSTELVALESKIQRLVDACELLAEENRLLRARETALLAERDQLFRNNEQARTRIEAMIARLKAMEVEA